MRIYLAGPMTGIKLFNFPAFDEAEARGKAEGFDMVSPAAMDRLLGFDETKDDMTGFHLKDAAKRDINAIAGCDAIALLPGWDKSRGARVELAFAEWIGLKVLDATTFLPFTNLPRRFRTVLDEAKGLVHGDRNAAYGPPTEDFTRTAGMWSALFGFKFEARDVAIAMIAVKLSRLRHAAKRDSWVDISGYAETGSWVDEG